jgi:hypothetical protein
VSPRRARATARLTVTEDFPTPPLPEETARTRAAGRDVGGDGPVLLGLRTGLVHEGRALGRGHLAQGHPHRGHPGERAHPALDVGPQLGAKRTAGDGEGHFHVDLAVGGHRHGPDHPEIDDVVAELGIDDAQEGGPDRLDRGRRGRDGHTSMVPASWILSARSGLEAAGKR